VNEDIALNIFNMLLDKGADPYYKEDNKQNVLYYLAKDGTFICSQEKLKSFKNCSKLINTILMKLINIIKLPCIGQPVMDD